MAKLFGYHLLVLLGTGLLANDMSYCEGVKNATADVELTKIKKINIKSLKSRFDKDIWHVSSESPMMCINIVFKNEGERNFQDQLGILELLVGTISEGAGDLDAHEFRKLLADHNILLTITSDNDNIIVNVQFLKKYFNIAIKAVSDIISKPKFPEDKIELRKQLVLQMCAQAKFTPKYLANEKLTNLVRIGQYRYSFDETIAKVSKYGRADVLKVYNQLFSPTNAIITVVGNIDENILLDGIEKIYQEIKDRKNGFESGIATPDLTTNKAEYEHIECDNPQAVISFALPGVLRSDKHKIAKRAAIEMMGNGLFSSRFMKTVRENKGLVYGISMQFTTEDLQPIIVGKAGTRPENVEAVIAEIKKQLLDVHRNGFSQAELDDFKRGKVSRYILDNSQTLRTFVVNRRLDGDSIDQVNDYMNQYQNLTLKDVNDAAKELFDLNKIVFVSCGQKKETNGSNSIPKEPQSMSHKEEHKNDEIRDAAYEVNQKLTLNIQEKVLDNGMRIIVVPMDSHDSVYFGIGYFVGAADDPRDQIGLSHILEHMMFKDTKKYKSGEIKTKLDRFDAYTNAFTSDDYTFYMHQCNKAFLEKDIEIESDRMSNLIINPEEFEKEKQVVIEERKRSYESSPYIRFVYEARRKALSLYSTYAYPTIGYIDQILKYNKGDLEKHYHKYYVPNNAVALFVGDITIEEATKLIQKYFGGKPKNADIQRDRIVDPANSGLFHRIEHKSAQLAHRYFLLYYKIPEKYMNNNKHYVMAELLTNILEANSGPLYKILVDQDQIAQNATATLEARRFDYSVFSIFVVVKNDIAQTTIETKVFKILNDFIEKELDIKLLQSEKAKYLDQMDMMQDNPNDMTWWMIGHLTMGRPISVIKDYKNIVQSIQLNEFKAFAKDILSDKNKILISWSVPESEK